MQHTYFREPRPQRPRLIEVRGEPVGVLVPAGNGFKFVAVKLPVFSIDGQIFDSPELAQAAAASAASDKSPGAPAALEVRA